MRDFIAYHIFKKSPIFVPKTKKMKIFLKQILTFLCAGYFLLALSGYNIVRYCCDGCADAGIMFVAKKSCHAIHQAKEHFATTCCSKSSPSQCEEMNEGCEVLRIQTDVPSLVVKSASQQHDSDFSSECLNLFLCFCNKHKSQAELSATSPPDKKVFHSGRDILTLNAVLLI
jgi:hypothetical protein